MIKKTIKTEIEYIFTEKELKEKLGLKGKITEGGLFSGYSPDQEKKAKSHDSVTWYITTQDEQDAV